MSELQKLTKVKLYVKGRHVFNAEDEWRFMVHEGNTTVIPPNEIWLFQRALNPLMAANATLLQFENIQLGWGEKGDGDWDVQDFWVYHAEKRTKELTPYVEWIFKCKPGTAPEPMWTAIVEIPRTPLEAI